LKDGTRLTYHLNGFNSLVLTLFLWFLFAHHWELFSASIIVDNIVGFAVVANAWALIFSVILLVKALASGVAYTGFLHGFVLGSELNPRMLGLDCKMFSLRPGMIGWVLLNLSFLGKHMQLNHGEIAWPIALAVGMQVFYVLDYLWFEEYMTSTWDIISEHFGLMLVWADYVFIPFCFTVAQWHLLYARDSLSSLQAIAILEVFVVGFVIFRWSNIQKHTFKHSPSSLVWGRPPETIAGKLLVSGFWRYSRHANYLGDILIGLAWCLPVQRGPIWAYFYFFYIVILLVQRERRDNQRCQEKYKATWAAYTKKVPYRIVPWVY